MRKWTYLVAALLVGGATTTFTGCIDNDEPAGIEQLRGAKAEFIKAKAAYEDALTQIQLVKVEREKVKLEKDQVNLELKKCSLEVEQAKTAEQKAFWEAEAQKRTEEFKAKMLDLQTLTAQAEYNNKKALMDIEVALLTMKDDAYTAEINKYRAALVGYTFKSESTTNGETTITTNSSYGALADLAEAKSSLMKAEVARINFLSKNKYYPEELQLARTHAAKTLEIQMALMEEYKTLDATGTDSKALADKLKGYKTDLQALDAKEDEAYTKIEEMRKPIFPINQQIIEEKVKLGANAKYILAKSDVDAALQSGLVQALYGQQLNVGNFENVFVSEGYDLYWNNIYSMKADWIVNTTLSEEATLVNGVASAIKEYYIEQFCNAYDQAIGTKCEAYEVFDINTGHLTEAYRAKLANELSRLTIDKDPAYKQFYSDSLAWVKAYDTYIKALKTYKNYKGTNAYAAISKEIEDYVAKKTEDKTLADANTLRTSVLGYLTRREAVDGVTSAFAVTYKDALTDANLATFNTEISNAVGNLNSILGSENLATSGNLGKSTLADFLKSSQALFGTGLDLTQAIEPKEIEEGKYDMPEGLEITSGSLGKYSMVVKGIDMFTNIDKWQALYDKVKAQADSIIAQTEAIQKNIDDLEAQIKDANAALWQAELACYLIKGDKSKRQNVIFSESNPYKNYYTSNEQEPLLGNVVTEYSKLEAEIALVQRAMEDGYFYYTYYDANSHTYKVS